jgi:electron transport complex protein RnfE
VSKALERIYNGVIKENPTFVLMLGMCPTLAVTTSAINGVGMGLTTTAVLIMSNMLISMLRKVIPDKVRMPAFIVVVASFVTIVQLLLQAYIPVLNDSLGIYIPLIVVNCIILGRAESYASKYPVFPSIFDGVGMGLGFTVGLTLIGLFRELLGAGTAFGFSVMPDSYEPFSIFVLAPGAFFVLSMLTALQNKLKLKSATNTPQAEKLACGGNCSSCSGSACHSNHELLESVKEETAKKEAAAKKAAAEKALAAKKETQAKEAANQTEKE